MSEKTLSRRDFVKLAGATAGGAATLGSTGAFRALSAGEAARLSQQSTQIKYTADVMCPAECGVMVKVENGVASAIYGNPHVPYNAGTLCAKGAAGLQLVYNANRIKYPMIRVGARGEGKFKRVTWDEAIAFIADKLTAIKKTYGPEAVIMDAGDVTDRDTYWRLFFAFGTPNCTEHGAICDTPRRHGPRLMFGGKRVEPDVMRPVLLRQADGTLKNDYSYRTKLIVYAGWNPFTATRINYESRGTVGAKVAGARIIVIDPALSNTATKADRWIPIRPGTDPDLFAAILRYVLEHDNPKDPSRSYIDWTFRDKSVGWDEFRAAFQSWWAKKDPANNLQYFTLEWASERTGIPADTIAELAHSFGITKPAAFVWGMHGTGHHYNGYIASILGTTLNVITGNFDAPGGVIDTELTKSDKGGSATGKSFLARPVKRVVGGKEVQGKQDELHMDSYGDWPAAWDDVVGDYPRRMLKGVTLKQGPFRGRTYPIKAYILRTGNSVITGSATWRWQEALTARDGKGNYNVDLVVYVDTPFLESGLYADVVLPEASYLERVSLSDVYPSHPVIWLRDFVIDKQFESKTPFEIMNALARALHARGDTDIQPADFWEKYRDEADFWTEALAGAPGKPNVGSPLPYPRYPEGYKIIGTPDSLEAGRVTIDDEKKEIRGERVTVKWLREHHGVAVWPMSYFRYPGGILKTSSKKIEFKWDWTEATDKDAKRYGQYAKYNKLVEESGSVPPGIAALGWTRYPSTFYWFETWWNPYSNPAYAKYKKEYPFQLTSGRIHHAMSGTQMVDWLGRMPAEDTWLPINDAVTYQEVVVGADGPTPTGRTLRLPANTWAIAVIQMAASDARTLGLKTGDLVELANPLGQTARGKVNAVETIRPGVLRVAFGGGGRFSPGLGRNFYFKDVTPNHNDLVDPDDLSPIMGQPAYADMLVKVRKV
ncbi:MAG: dehydrogenase [Candidatus Rokubacteria bacterium RBG_16_73_20]|nr:MAG: dehydrogenase [Candidatus Rokubacteria bacterium GWA2_73_35]OGK94682.1 MAG: dehydrogenase [Candidatus Rokubacteria bacterium RBG_16_73_20]HBH04202.1 dehydrogenase [Candidatus Rokubacteria bacterium]